jgi:hypothetical protein
VGRVKKESHSFNSLVYAYCVSLFLLRKAD